MAERNKFTTDDEKGKGGGGNRNAIAYGLLQGAGYNTYGMSPAEAWDLVSQLNLMESKRWKRTDEDKKKIKRKNEELKRKGYDTNSLEAVAKANAKKINLSGVKNEAALKEAVDTIDKIRNEYNLKQLEVIRIKRLSNGTMASANEMTVNIGDKLARNPHAAYRICVTDFKSNLEATIADAEFIAANATNARTQLRAQKTLDNLKEMSKYSRHNVVYEGQEMESVITHEMAHVIAGQNFGFSTGFGNTSQALAEISAVYNESKTNGDIYRISVYAAEDVDEFWAEAFTMYKMGKEEMPPKIKSMVEGVLKKYV